MTAIALVALMTLAACSKKDSPKVAASSTSSSAASSSAAESSAESSAPASSSAPESSAPASSSAPATGDKVTVNWFVGLGTGANPEQLDAQKKVVDGFNASQSEITLKLTVVTNTTAATNLATQIAGGKAPDLVGPVGIRGSNQFEGQWLDLAPLVASQKFDTSKFDQKQMDAAKDANGVQTALPFGVYPSFIWYNKDLFDAAGVAYPPHKFGDKYADGREWNMDTLRDIAKKLTQDSDGNDASSPKFNPDKIVEWGYNEQFGADSLQKTGTFFGAGSFVADDKKTAQIPKDWLDGWKWHYDMVWKDHSAPNNKQLQSDTLNKGNAFVTGKVAMTHVHTWYVCCMKDSKNKAKTFWDIAAVPSNNGKITAALHQDTFRILKSTAHPEQAFKVLSYFLTTAAPDLLKLYNAMPADPSLQDAYFASLDKDWPQKVDWQVAKDALKYPDVPNHEGWTPSFTKAETRAAVLGTKLITSPGLDLDAEAKSLQADLQKIFDAAPSK
ncbi:MAG: extracellular solute-binding protein [Actinomycetota bacterium]